MAACGLKTKPTIRNANWDVDGGIHYLLLAQFMLRELASGRLSSSDASDAGERAASRRAE